MPPQRKTTSRRTASGSFYDHRGAIAESPPSPRTPSTALPATDGDASMQDSDGEGDGGYTLTAKGELSPADAFTLPPSPTQTLKHRYRVYRPKLARQATKSRVSGKSSTAGGAYRGAVDEEYAALLGISPYSRGSPKRDFQALMQRYRESARGWSDAPANAYLSSPGSSASGSPSPLRRQGSGTLKRTRSGVLASMPESPTPLRRQRSAARVDVVPPRA